MGEEGKGTLPDPTHFTKAGVEFHRVVTQVGTRAPVGGDGGVAGLVTCQSSQH